METISTKLTSITQPIPKFLTPAANRVNYIMCKHDKVKKRFDLSKLEMTSTQASDFIQKISFNQNSKMSENNGNEFRSSKGTKNNKDFSQFHERENEDPSILAE